MRYQGQVPKTTGWISEKCRATPSVDGKSLRDWRNLTSDSSIQILNLEMDETFLNGFWNNGGLVNNLDQTMSTITEYDPKVMSLALMDTKNNFSRRYSGSRRLSILNGNLSTADILTNTWDNLKDARLVMYLEEVNKAMEYKTENQSNLHKLETVNLENKSVNGTVKDLKVKHLQKRFNSDTVLDLSKAPKVPRRRTGSDVSSKPWNRKECLASFENEAPDSGLVQPLSEIKYESKVGPVKRVKLTTLRKDTRYKVHRNNRALRNARAARENRHALTEQSQVLFNPSMSKLHDKTFSAIPYDSRSLSNFLLENETIPAINGATPIGNSMKNKLVNRVEPNFTRTPSLRASRPRSMATSDLKGFQCKRALDFDGSFESDVEDPHSSTHRISEEFNEFETVLNLCTRKPRLGLAGKNTNKTMVLDKSAICDIKQAISKSSKRMNIKTNGTLNILPKITKVSSRQQKSPRRKSSSVGSRRRSMDGVSPDLQFRAVFESHV